jgi:MFS transporter, PAT family, beta-lactamase induction signal transducer AmpG
MNQDTAAPPTEQRKGLIAGIKPYVEPAPLAALFLGISSAFPFTMIGATLSTMLRQNEVTRATVTAFALTFLMYNFKFLWAPLVDTVKLPGLHRFGQRRSWLWLIGIVCIVAVIYLGSRDPISRRW